MGEYLYQCEEKHQARVAHGMLENPRVACPVCGKEMRRRPMRHNVLWSRFIEPSPAVKKHLDHISEKVESNYRKYGK